MYTQIFKITRLPEEDPLSEREIRTFIFRTRENSEWSISEVPELQNALEELKDSVSFFEKVQSATDEERMAVGTDHYDRLIKASKELSEII